VAYQGGGILCFAGPQCNDFKWSYRPSTVPLPLSFSVPSGAGWSVELTVGAFVGASVSSSVEAPSAESVPISEAPAGGFPAS